MTKSHLTTYIRVKITLILITIVVFASFSQSSVGIGTVAPHQSAILDVYSTNKGLLPPRMSKDQMDAINSPAEGLMIYCSDCTPNGVYIYDNNEFRMIQFFENPLKYLNIADVSVPIGTPSFVISPALIPSGATVDYKLIRKPLGVSISGTRVTIPEDMNAGEYSIAVKATGKGDYNGKIGATFRLNITRIALTGLSIPPVSVLRGTTSFDTSPTLRPSEATAVYSLTAYNPTVSINGTTVSIPEDMNVGEYSITVKAIGNGDYNGEIGAIFKLYVLCFSFNSRTITDYNCTDTNVIIPASIGGVAVTSIGSQAFYKNKLNFVTIPNSVTSIGSAAFYNNKLNFVTIPNSVTSIGDYAFSRNQLTFVAIPNSVTSIEYSAFRDNRLSDVIISDSVTSISGYTFYSNNLTSVYIPSSVTSIGNNAFRNNQLTSISIKRGTTYESNSFGGCTVANGCIRIRP